jgi:Fic family protein
VDGNGRCARALFYWSTLRQGYWLCEYISISQVIHRAIARYYRAFLYTETDDNDLSYFVLYHLDVIWKAIQELHEYIKRKAEQLQAAERLVRGAAGLNHRQCALIGHALRHSDARYSIESHRSSHNVVYQTARTDLLDMATKGLLVADKHGRTWYFRPARNLEEKLRELGR